MGSEFLESYIWPRITKSAKSSRSADVAVAYFSKGASKLLPLSAGSRLVVDASEASIKAGLTCPKDLLALHRRGCHIFSAPGLHAKVYVFGTRAYIGSANVSQNSAGRLREAMVVTTERRVVAEARAFVRSLCNERLGPESLKDLQELYRPPKLPMNGSRKSTSAASPLRIVQLRQEEWSAADEEAASSGRKKAKEVHSGPEWRLDEFSWFGQCAFRLHDRIVQFTDEGNGRVMVDPVATVLSIEPVRGPKKRVIVQVEIFKGLRRRSIDVVAKKLGRGAKTKLRRSGVIRDANFANHLRDVLK